MSLPNDRELSDAELRMSARELVGDPMEGIPSELTGEMAPFLKMATTFGTGWADSSVLHQPIPWPAEHGERVLASMVEAFDDLTRKELQGLEEPIFGAMHRQCFIAFSERMDALMSSFKATEGARSQ